MPSLVRRLFSLHDGILERKLFRISLLIVTILSFVGGIIALFIPTDNLSRIFIFFGAIAFGTIYFIVSTQKNFQIWIIPFCILSLIFLSVNWLLFDGIHGTMPIGYVFLLVLVLIMSERKMHFLLVSLFILNLLVLVVIEIYFSHFVRETPEEWVISLNLFVFLFLFIIGITFILGSHKKLLVHEADIAIRKNEELSQFSYIVSHDLKAPLRGIASIADWVLEDNEGKLSEDSVNHLHLLKGRVDRLEKLIDGILMYSKIGRELEPYRRVDVDLLVKEIIDLISPEKVEVKVLSHLPSVYGNKTQIQQIFINLMQNAVKFIGRPDGVIEIDCQENSTHYTFSVKDNGRGIPKEFHEKIFKIFQTLESKEKTNSTGLGLAIVSKIVTEVGGEIWVESEEGKGAKFIFQWPKRPELPKHN